MPTELPIPVGASARDLVYQAVYTGRAEMGHWLAAYTDARQAQIDNEKLRSVGLAPRPASPPMQPLPADEDAAKFLIWAEAEEAVPAEVAAAYRALIEARTLAEPGADPTEADAARVRERYGVVHAWLETQG